MGAVCVSVLGMVVVMPLALIIVVVCVASFVVDVRSVVGIFVVLVLCKGRGCRFG